MRRLPLLFALLAASGCSTPGATAQAPESPKPTILVTYTSPTPGAPTPAAAASAEPVATPSPEPAPTQLESTSFFFTRPAGWTIESQSASPEAVRLRAPDGNATFAVAMIGTGALADRRAKAVEEAGPGLLANTGITIDQVTGYYITSNRDDAEGKRYHAEYGFAYRDRLFTLHASWDKRLPGADTASNEIQTIIKSFRWL